jgi:hypothetical protein
VQITKIAAHHYDQGEEVVMALAGMGSVVVHVEPSEPSV